MACRERKVECPVYATIAISEAVLHVPALKNPLIHSFSSHISAQSELSGAYIILEQSDPGSYFWNSKDPLMSLLVLIDDIHRGARKTVVVNYIGTFGLVARAVGAQFWSSGYFLNQRRFSLRGKMGIAHPRYHSLAMAGDIGLKTDLKQLQQSGFANRLMTPSDADAVLRAALNRGKEPADVPEWKYSPNNCSAAQKHYLEVVSDAGAKLDSLSTAERLKWTHGWLRNAAQVATTLREKKLVGMATDTDHQKVWFDVFEEWRSYAKQ